MLKNRFNKYFLIKTLYLLLNLYLLIKIFINSI